MLMHPLPWWRPRGDPRSAARPPCVVHDQCSVSSRTRTTQNATGPTKEDATRHDTRVLWTHLGAGKWEVGEAVAALADRFL